MKNLLNFSLAAFIVKVESVFLVTITVFLVLVLLTPFIVWVGYKFMGDRFLSYASYRRFDEFVVRYLSDSRLKLMLYCLVMISIGLFFFSYLVFIIFFLLFTLIYLIIVWNNILLCRNY